MRILFSTLATVSVVLTCAVAFAQVVEPQFVEGAVGSRSAYKREVPAMVSAARTSTPAVHLEDSMAIAPDQVFALMKSMGDPNGPTRDGFERVIRTPIPIGGSKRIPQSANGVSMTMVDGRERWFARVDVQNADRVRLKLSSLRLSSDANLWVWSNDDAPVWFDVQNVDPEGNLWTPSVSGGHIYLEASLPAGKELGFNISSVMEIFVLQEIEPTGNQCLVDATCISASDVTDITALRGAIARLSFVKDGGSYLCTGGLVNDKVTTTTIPYLLTANHCFDSQTSASSLEAYWDYKTASCGAAFPSLSMFPRSNGATLLATSPASDFTFVRLNSIPAARWLLGWDPRTTSTTAGTTLNRVAHPEGYPQSFTQYRVVAPASYCSGRPVPQYIYTMPTVGATAVGSSGSPIVLPGGYIVGQLTGGCGPDPSDPCNVLNKDMDGAMAMTYSSISTYLEGAPATCSACTPSSTIACALGNRFKLEMRWRNQFFVPVTEGVGKVIRYAENKPEVHPEHGPLSEMVYFSMFDFAPTRVELVVKMFKGIKINDQFWVFAGGMTNNEYWLKITDTQTCRTWERYNEHGKFQIIADQRAFPLP